MSLFSRLFGGGGGAKAETQAEEYNGYRIFPEPIRESGGHRLCARIEKDVEGQTLTHKMVRADTIQDPEEAKAFSLRKAKQVIDEQGDRIFG